MKKVIMGLALLSSISANVFAETMACNVVVYEATSAGINNAKEFNVKLKVMESRGNDYCVLNKYKNLTLETCAAAADIIGGYGAIVIISEEEDENSHSFPQMSYNNFGTLKTSKKIQSISGSDVVPYSIQSKFKEAGLSIPDELTRSDSSSLDQAVEEGIAKGIIAEGEIAAIAINDCQLTE